ncbi:MAG: flagellar hook protein FlgE [Vicinamibacterales bacterium]
MAVGSFSAGLSGLNANSVYLNVIGNNLANINTVGYKASTVTFQDLVSQTVGGTSLNPLQVGLGVTTNSISPLFSQGTIENSREATNVAIQGNGFFVVRGPEGGNVYTRAGTFSFNSDGKLVTPDGFFVQGYTQFDPITGELVSTGALSDIAVSPGALRAPIPTGEIRITSNLSASAAATETFTSAVQFYDALGATHVATVTYTKGATPQAWTYDITLPGEDVVGGTPGTPFSVHAGSVTFDSTGALLAVDGALPADIALTTPAFLNGAAASVINWDVLDETSGEAYLTGYAAPSATASINQNGKAAGSLDNISVAADGTIVATLGAGQSVTLGQLVLANFNNPKGLVKLGNSRYAEGQAAGAPNIGVAQTGGRGALVGSALEQSNVDIAQEFTQMILAQRGYQANAKTITVSDELLVDTLNLKR